MRNDNSIASKNGTIKTGNRNNKSRHFNIWRANNVNTVNQVKSYSRKIAKISLSLNEFSQPSNNTLEEESRPEVSSTTIDFDTKTGGQSDDSFAYLYTPDRFLYSVNPRLNILGNATNILTTNLPSSEIRFFPLAVTYISTSSTNTTPILSSVATASILTTNMPPSVRTEGRLGSLISVNNADFKSFLPNRLEDPVSLSHLSNNCVMTNSPTQSQAANTSHPQNVALNARELCALKRKEKSRIAAKQRRNKESVILNSLLHALPVSLDVPSELSAADENQSDSAVCLNLEKSGVIRIAGQTLLIYKSLSHILGTKSIPMISLLSQSIFGIIIHTKERTVAYSTPPLAKVLGWPWINMIGAKLVDILDENQLQSVETTEGPIFSLGQVVVFRILETGILAKSAPGQIRSSNFQSTSPNLSNPFSIWSAHLYRCKSNANNSKKHPTTLTCSCFAVIRLPKMRKTNPLSEFKEEGDLNLYLLQPIYQLESSIQQSIYVQDITTFCSTNHLPGMIGNGLSINSSIRKEIDSKYIFESCDLKNFEFHNEFGQAKLDFSPNDNIDLKPDRENIKYNNETSATFYTELDPSSRIKFSTASEFIDVTNIAGKLFLDLVHLEDLVRIGDLLDKCISDNILVLTPPYRLCLLRIHHTIPIWVRSSFHPSQDETCIKCTHFLIGTSSKEKRDIDLVGKVYSLQTLLSNRIENSPSYSGVDHLTQDNDLSDSKYMPKSVCILRCQRKSNLCHSSHRSQITTPAPKKFKNLESNRSQFVRSVSEFDIISMSNLPPSFNLPKLNEDPINPLQAVENQKFEQKDSNCRKQEEYSNDDIISLSDMLRDFDEADLGLLDECRLQSFQVPNSCIDIDDHHNHSLLTGINFRDILMTPSSPIMSSDGRNSNTSSSPFSISESNQMQSSFDDIDPEFHADMSQISDEIWNNLLSDAANLPFESENFKADISKLYE